MQAQVADLIAQLKGIFSGWPASLRTDEHEKNYGREFMKAMAQFKIVSSHQIKRGMMRARREAEAGERYLPSGATFAGWCKPSAEELNIPDLDTVYDSVIFGQWGRLPESLKVVFVNERYNIRQLSTAQARKKITDIYNDTVRRLSNGEIIEFPKVDKLAPPPKPKVTGPTGNVAMQGMLSMMGSRKARG